MLQVRCANPTGTGEPGQPLSPLRRTAPPFAPKRPFGTFRCCAWLIFDFAPTHLRCAGVPLGLFGKPKRSSFSRFAASIKPYYALFSKTHMLQVRCANPMGTGEPGKPLRRCAPAPPFAPKRPFGTFRCCAWLIKIREHTVLSYLKRSCFRFAALTLRVQGSQGNPSVRCGGQLPLHRGARATPQSAAADSSPYAGEPRQPFGRRC